MFQMRREKYSVHTLLAKSWTQNIFHIGQISEKNCIIKQTPVHLHFSFFIIQQKTHLQSAHLDAIYLCLKAHFLKERNKMCIPQSSLLQVIATSFEEKK